MPTEVARLTTRQRQVIELLEQGLTLREIALELNISVRTVRVHTDALKKKLKVDRLRRLPAALRGLELYEEREKIA